MFVYELSGCGFESRCSHLIFRYGACFEQGVPWHSGNCRVWIHSQTRTWHDKNIQSRAVLSFVFLLAFERLWLCDWESEIRCKSIETNTRRSIGQILQSWEKTKLLITDSCGTVTLFQHQQKATLVVLTLKKRHMKFYSWSNFLMTQYGVWCNI